jgi:hypothetical protein
MDVKSYCDTVGVELTGWKAKLYDVIRRSEKMAGNDRENVKPMVAELKDMVDDLDGRIAALARECPTEWEVWGVMGEKEYGIGGA